MIRRQVNDEATRRARRWFAEAARPEIDRAIRSVHDDLAREVAEHQPRCVQSGRCCNFESYGHRLYVTGLETAWTLARIPRVLTADDVDRARDAGTCPFLSDRQCLIHHVRPMGCRMFFCDPTARDWQREAYERFHARIAAIHDEHTIPYEYAEWRSVMRACTAALPDRPLPDHTRAAGRLADPAYSDSFVQIRIS